MQNKACLRFYSDVWESLLSFFRVFTVYRKKIVWVVQIFHLPEVQPDTESNKRR